MDLVHGVVTVEPRLADEISVLVLIQRDRRSEHWTPPLGRHQTGCGRIPIVANASVPMAELSASSCCGGARRCNIGVRERSDDGESRVDRVFQPNTDKGDGNQSPVDSDRFRELNEERNSMRSYSPFDAPVGNLNPTDLVALRGVTEGWYVEYKSGPVRSRTLAKALSAFANTYGGWLFLGVCEKSKDDPVAGLFPGIPNAEVDATLQRLRQCAAEYLNPSPYFLTQTLRGPCNEVGLDPGASIIAVHIPQSHATPHVHKDGRIYRRVADGSEPKPESDRFTLDQLWRRGGPVRDRVRNWVESDPEFSKAEEDVPYVRLLLCVDPWGQHDSWLDAPLPRIRSIMMDDTVPFDTFYTTADGFLARQAKNNDPHNFVLTWRIRRDLSCDIVMPLPRYATSTIDLLAVELDGYAYAERFVSVLRAQEYHNPRVADLNFLMNLLVDFVAKYRRLLELANATEREFYF